MPIFLRSVPERNPRTECGCQPVTFISSVSVNATRPLEQIEHFGGLAAIPAVGLAPLAFFALLGTFLAGLAFFPDFSLAGATSRDVRQPCPFS